MSKSKATTPPSSPSSKSSKTATTPPASTKPKPAAASTGRRKQKYRALGGGSLKPVVKVALVGPNGKQLAPQLALIDSGCDLSTFPSAWAPLLGINFKKDCDGIEGQTASGTDKMQRIYKPGIHGLILGHKVPLHAVFNPRLPIALLGREDFFTFFRVDFDQRKKMAWLAPY